MDSVISTLLVTLQIQVLGPPSLTNQTHGFRGSKVGCPIRKFLDQSPFAAPQDLSQRTTSFIASQHQGIHRIPLRHLIDLIIHAGSLKERAQRGETHTYHPEPRQIPDGHKDQLASTLPSGTSHTNPKAEAQGPCLRSSTTFIRSG
jgi:hypothetical protein